MAQALCTDDASSQVNSSEECPYRHSISEYLTRIIRDGTFAEAVASDDNLNSQIDEALHQVKLLRLENKVKNLLTKQLVKKKQESDAQGNPTLLQQLGETCEFIEFSDEFYPDWNHNCAKIEFHAGIGPQLVEFKMEREEGAGGSWYAYCANTRASQAAAEKEEQDGDEEMTTNGKQNGKEEEEEDDDDNQDEDEATSPAVCARDSGSKSFNCDLDDMDTESWTDLARALGVHTTDIPSETVAITLDCIKKWLEQVREHLEGQIDY